MKYFVIVHHHDIIVRWMFFPFFFPLLCKCTCFIKESFWYAKVKTSIQSYPVTSQRIPFYLWNKILYLSPLNVCVYNYLYHHHKCSTYFTVCTQYKEIFTSFLVHFYLFLAALKINPGVKALNNTNWNLRSSVILT